MGVLVIHDLPESVDLDRQAMAAVTGGAMVHAHQTMLAPQPFPHLHTGAPDAGLARTPKAEAVASHAQPTLLR
ncbi:hypothetical protein C5O80_14950 [Burkholderia sp. SRS-46]|nr:hypothetical protein C5O80_14950 [Burkholderia sp. SRS-46]